MLYFRCQISSGWVCSYSLAWLQLNSSVMLQTIVGACIHRNLSTSQQATWTTVCVRVWSWAAVRVCVCRYQEMVMVQATVCVCVCVGRYRMMKAIVCVCRNTSAYIRSELWCKQQCVCWKISYDSVCVCRITSALLSGVSYGVNSSVYVCVHYSVCVWIHLWCELQCVCVGTCTRTGSPATSRYQTWLSHGVQREFTKTQNMDSTQSLSSWRWWMNSNCMPGRKSKALNSGLV